MAQRITLEDESVRLNYEAAKPNSLGDLHQRMKAVMQLAQGHVASLPSDLWQALWDLKLEVQYHEPAKPPFGKRTVPTRKTL